MLKMKLRLYSDFLFSTFDNDALLKPILTAKSVCVIALSVRISFTLCASTFFTSNGSWVFPFTFIFSTSFVFRFDGAVHSKNVRFNKSVH